MNCRLTRWVPSKFSEDYFYFSPKIWTRIFFSFKTTVIYMVLSEPACGEFGLPRVVSITTVTRISITNEQAPSSGKISETRCREKPPKNRGYYRSRINVYRLTRHRSLRRMRRCGGSWASCHLCKEQKMRHFPSSLRYGRRISPGCFNFLFTQSAHRKLFLVILVPFLSKKSGSASCACLRLRRS
jgi:hypothetical protein